MDIRGNELELCLPLPLNVDLVGCAAFVVKDLEVNALDALCEAGHDPICGGEAVAVVAGFKWLYQDYIGIHMIGENNEVVAALRANGEPAHVISVNLADEFRCDVELF